MSRGTRFTGRRGSEYRVPSHEYRVTSTDNAPGRRGTKDVIMRTISIGLTLFLVPSAACAADADPVRAAIDRGLKRLDQGSASYVKNPQCFSCHHQALTIAALSSAQQRGITIDPELLQQQLGFTLATFTN